MSGTGVRVDIVALLDAPSGLAGKQLDLAITSASFKALQSWTGYIKAVAYLMDRDHLTSSRLARAPRSPQQPTLDSARAGPPILPLLDGLRHAAHLDAHHARCLRHAGVCWDGLGAH